MRPPLVFRHRDVRYPWLESRENGGVRYCLGCHQVCIRPADHDCAGADRRVA
jgi:hypothetical protein